MTTTPTTQTPEFGTLLERAIAAFFGRVRGPMIASVVNYERSTARADCEPVNKLWVDNAYITNPVVRAVPVLFPRGVANAITWDLLPGDFVLLLPGENAIANWSVIGKGSEQHEPESRRRFSLSDVVALPGLNSLLAPPVATQYAAGALVVSGADVRLGSSAAFDYVALATRVLAELNSIVGVFNSHVHGGVTTGPGSTAIPTPIIPNPSSVAATQVKAI